MPVAKPKKRAKPLKIEWLVQQPLWKILAIAITDMRKQERAPRSKLKMRLWFNKNGECVACAAGSVLRWSCGVETNEDFSRICGRTISLRHAIDALRVGMVVEAAAILGRKYPRRFDGDIREYELCPAGFWKDVIALQKRLKAADI